MTRDEILNMPAGREMNVLVAEAMGEEIFLPVGNKETVIAIDEGRGGIRRIPNYSTDIVTALSVAEKLELTLVPIPVSKTEGEWDCSWDHKPVAIWWAVFQASSSPSVYLPIEQYDKEWKGWVNSIDESITLDMVAETLPLAICRAVLIKAEPEIT